MAIALTKDEREKWHVNHFRKLQDKSTDQARFVYQFLRDDIKLAIRRAGLVE